MVTLPYQCVNMFYHSLMLLWCPPVARKSNNEETWSPERLRLTFSQQAFKCDPAAVLAAGALQVWPYASNSTLCTIKMIYCDVAGYLNALGWHTAVNSTCKSYDILQCRKKKMADVIAAKSLMEAALAWPPIQCEVDLFLWVLFHGIHLHHSK